MDIWIGLREFILLPHNRQFQLSGINSRNPNSVLCATVGGGVINAKFFKFNLKFVHLYKLESKLRTVFDKVSNIMFSLNKLFRF